MASKQREWQLRKIAEGKCPRCGKPNPGTVKAACPDCLPAFRAWRRDYLRRRHLRLAALVDRGQLLERQVEVLKRGIAMAVEGTQDASG